MATERLHAHEATARALEAELAALRLQHAREAAATEDVLAAQQREQRRLQAAGAELERQVGAGRGIVCREPSRLHPPEQRACPIHPACTFTPNACLTPCAQLDAARREAAQLQRALQEELEAAAAAEESSDDEQPSSELQRMLSHQRRQEDRLAAQAREIEGLRARLQRSELRLQQSEGAAAALRVRASSRAELRFVRGAPWLLRVERERLTGALPAAPQPGAWLAAAGRRLLLKCPPATEAEEGPQQGVLHSLDPASGVWSSAVCSGGGVDGVAPVVGRAVCSVGSKLLSFGGSQQGQLLPSHLCTQLLLPDLLEWRAAPPPADPAAPQPTPRRDAALAHCPQSNAAYLYGGRGADGVCLGDLWRLDLATHAWQQLDTVATSRPLADRARTPCASEVPPPRCGAALAVSPDGSRLWLMGGRLDSGHSTSALHW